MPTFLLEVSQALPLVSSGARRGWTPRAVPLKALSNCAHRSMATLVSG
jgi:hypothetical protein